MIDITLYNVKLGDTYCWHDNKAEWLETQKPFAKAGLDLAEWTEGQRYVLKDDAETVLVNQERLAELLVLGLKIVKTTPVVTQVNIANHLSEMAEKNVALSMPANNVYNNKCEVHMPGQALSMYNDVRLLEDSCSDVLQEALNEGWRIIAACPQPDQRRPDYILGRFDPKHDGDRSAKR